MFPAESAALAQRPLDTVDAMMILPETEPAGWSKALICIDMQRDFVEPGAPAAVSGATACIAAVERAASALRQERGIVIWVTRSYEADGSNVEPSRLARWRSAPFVVAGSPGAELVPGLGAAPEDVAIVKPSYSAFFGTDLDGLLSGAGVEELVLCGVDLARCVRATAVDGLSRGYSVTVLADASATRSDAAKRSNLDDLGDLGAVVLSSEEWLAVEGAAR
jgi:nicotinamidase-related amidase